MKWTLGNNDIHTGHEGAFMITIEPRAGGDGWLWSVGVDDALEDPERSDMGIAKTIGAAFVDAEHALNEITAELFDTITEAAA